MVGRTFGDIDENGLQQALNLASQPYPHGFYLTNMNAASLSI
jgi:hypothetical protein